MKEYIKKIIQNIVDKEFKSDVEKRIILHDDRINFRCPYCHEGRTKTKKRGNIYFNNLFFICFRCNKKTSFTKLSKDFNEQLDPNKKLEMIEHLNKNISFKDYEEDFLDAKFDDLIELKDIEKVFNEYDITQIKEFKPIQKNGGIYKYLIDRGITDDLQKDIYQAKYYISNGNYQPIIVMLNRKKNKVIGIQIRNLKSGKRRFFKIFNYETLLEWINLIKSDKIDVDINKIIIYNKLSYYFNIFNINFNDKITIFEGYIDSLFYPNSIGLVGVNTDSKFLENNNLDIQYFFDNDEIGHKKSEEKMKMGFPVFLWKKLFENIVSKKKTDDPHSLLNRISSIKDLNTLSKLKVNPFDNLKLYNFFSKDEFDLIWIPNLKNKKRIYKKDYNYRFRELN